MTCKSRHTAEVTASLDMPPSLGGDPITQAINKQDDILNELYSERRRRRVRFILGSVFIVWLLYNSVINVRNTTRISAEQRTVNNEDTLLVNCTTPGHACYDQANAKTGVLVSSIIDSILNEQQNEVTALETHQDALAAQDRVYIREELQLLLNELNKTTTPVTLPPAPLPPVPATTPTTVFVPPLTTTTPTTLTTPTTTPVPCRHMVLGICLDNLLG